MAFKIDASSQNKTFLSLARQFNYIEEDKTEENGSVGDVSEAKEDNKEADFYEIILELMELQEKIGKLQLVEKQVEMRDRFSGLTNPACLSWLLKDLTEISAHLSYIINNASKIQLKLANPAISNSLPLDSSLHQPVIQITKLLADIHFSADRCVSPCLT